MMKPLIKMYEWSELNPIRVHTLLFAARDIVYGSMIVLGIRDIKHSTLYANLMSWNAVAVFGLLLIAAGVIAGWATVRKHSRITSAAMGASALFWSFVSLSFIVSGNPAAGLMFLFGFTMTTGYMGYRYKWTREHDVVLNPNGEYTKEQISEQE